MAVIPKYMLRHTIAIEDATSTWGTFSTSRSLRCLVDYNIQADRRTTGTERYSVVTGYTLPTETVLEGSKVTLTDGTVGYVSAVATHTAPGLPTPDHIEFGISFGDVAGPAFGETVTIVTRAVAGVDAFGNDRYTTTTTDVPGCQVDALSSSENIVNGRTQIVHLLSVVLPPSTSITSADRMYIRGLEYAVDGIPEANYSSMTGTEPGITVTCRRTTG